MTTGSLHTRFVQALALLLALSVLLAACGDGEGESADNANQPAAQSTAASGNPTANEELTESEPTAEPIDASTSEAPDEAGTVDPPADPDATATSETPAAETQEDEPAEAENLAPEFGTIDNWYNGGPTTLADLRGTPVLLVFWADF